MAQSMKLKICHLYPDIMDTYGDTGNIITIKKRCAGRGIKTEVVSISLGENFKQDEFDLIFFGGGQDKTQFVVAKDLAKKAKSIKNSVENDAVLLSICGGYQLLQNYFKTLEGEEIKGISLFDAHTTSSTTRMIQNLLVKVTPELQNEISASYQSTINNQQSTISLIGFENHSGKTYLGKNLKPLGKVIKGSGNNGEDQTEGAVYKNAFGCYLHGSLLPKNPHFADYLISKALERRYGKIKLKPLDDTFEWQAHEQSIKTTRSQG